MKIVMVEDEFMVAKRLRRFIEQGFADKPVALHHFMTLDDARDFIATQHVDAVFLDLNLNGQDGFELLKEQLSCSFHTIVVSANADRAIEAFDLGVLDFIAKPFTNERVNKAIARMQDANKRGRTKYLSYRRLGNTELLAVEHIVYLKASGHYCEIITDDGQTVLHDKPLDKLLALLPESFVRIHRSYAAPIDRFKRLHTEEGSKYWLTMCDGSTLPVGRTRIKALKRLISA